MGRSFLDVAVERLVLGVPLALLAACGRSTTQAGESYEAGSEVDVAGSADRNGDEAEAGPPRHYVPGTLPSCMSDAGFVEPEQPDADEGGADAGAAQDGASDDVSIDASVDDAESVDASVDDAASADEPTALDEAGDETTVLAADLIEPGDPGTADVTFTIRADRGVHPISPLIYGTNDRTNFFGNGMGLLRAGGNRWTAFNWETGASNGGKDYKYQNDDNLSTSDVPGAAVLSTIQTAIANHATPLLTVPIVSYLAADKNAGGDVRTTPDYLTTRFRNNLPTKQADFSKSPDSNDSYVYQDEFVSWAKSAAAGNIVAFSLDNEPDLWVSTHPEVHPDKVSYDELVSRDIDFALAIKNTWPEAKVFGFVSFGWSGLTSLQGAPDAPEKGDFVDYYLSKMLQAECFYHQRLIDYMDLHWYSEIRSGRTRITSASNVEAVVEQRLQAPRTLWDPTYVEDTWITDPMGNLGAVPIALIPRMLDKIRRYYPGTQLSISEWTYGGGADISGALATADALGVFGKAGLGAAANWPLNAGPYTWAAFRAFGTFDGKGGHFGDTSIDAVTSDVQATSVYASIGSNDPNHAFVVAINKDPADKVAAITIAHPVSFTSAAVYTLTAAGGPKVVPAAPIAATAQNAFLYTMPARSLSVLVLAP